MIQKQWFQNIVPKHFNSELQHRRLYILHNTFNKLNCGERKNQKERWGL